jgi:hypothetical protein
MSGLNISEKTAFLAKLDAVLEKQNYSTFEQWRTMAGSVFSDDDLPELKHVLMTGFREMSSELAGRYYDRVAGLLSYDEKVSVLSVLLGGDENRAIALAELHDSQGNLSKAIDTLSDWLKKNISSNQTYGNAWSTYLDLLSKGNRDLSDVAAEAIVSCPRETMLTKIIAITTNEHARYESLLEEKTPNKC